MKHLEVSDFLKLQIRTLELMLVKPRGYHILLFARLLAGIQYAS
jgi:hypothetical protein